MSKIEHPRLSSRASPVLPQSKAADVVQLRPKAAAKGSAASDAKGLVISKANVGRLTCPPGVGELIHWDSALPGLGLRCRASGARSWIVRYRLAGRERKATLGDPSHIDPAQAREMAKQTLAQVAQGGDPTRERAATRTAMRLGEVFEHYLDHAAHHQRPRTHAQTARNLRHYAKALHRLTVDELSNAAPLQSLLTKIAGESGPIQANRVRAALSSAFTWATKARLMPWNPTPATTRRPEKPRERVLSRDELLIVWQATAGLGDYDRIIRLAMLTGLRRGEVADLRWSEVGEDRLMIPASRMKGKLPHTMPLTSLAKTQLPERREEIEAVFGEGDTGFSGFSKAKAALDKRIAALRPDKPMEPWTPHDLRRSLATHLNEFDPTLGPIVERLLAHVGSRSTLQRVYDRSDAFDTKMALLAQWETWLFGEGHGDD